MILGVTRPTHTPSKTKQIYWIRLILNDSGAARPTHTPFKTYKSIYIEQGARDTSGTTTVYRI